MRIGTLFIAAAAGMLIPFGCSSNNGTTETPPPVPIVETGDPTKPGYFVDMTAQSGIRFVYENGQEAGHYAILESLGGGVALIDYDRDGLLDIFLPGGGYYTPDKKIHGHPCALFRNEGDWKFREVTKEVGLDKIAFYSHGGTVGDYDSDGWPDLLVTGYGAMTLFRNDKGEFVDVTVAAGLRIKEDMHWSTSAGFADFDGDGFNDLFVCHYVNWDINKNHPTCNDSTGRVRDVCSPKQFEGLPHRLFLNNQKGGFVDASQEAVVEMDANGKATYKPLKPGKGLGVLIVDINHDGKPDIYIGNDTTDNYLYVNRGKGKFEELATPLGVARDENNVPNGSMGVTAADYDGSGHFSIFVTNYQHEAHQLYRNKGQGPFHFASTRAGIMAIGLVYVGWGTTFIDYDRDGAEDIFIVNGHVVRHPPPPGTLKQRPVLLKNLRQPGEQPFSVRFKEVSKEGGPFFWQQHMGRGCAIGDLDNDGRPDIVVAHIKENVTLLRNDVKNDNHWLGFEVVGKPCRDAVGTELILETEIEFKGQKQAQKLHRQVLGGGSWASSNDRRILFGLNAEYKPVVKSLTVKWPSGKESVFSAGALEGAPRGRGSRTLDRYWRVVEGEAELQEWKAGMWAK
jgi:hypothetical protein